MLKLTLKVAMSTIPFSILGLAQAAHDYETLGHGLHPGAAAAVIGLLVAAGMAMFNLIREG